MAITTPDRGAALFLSILPSAETQQAQKASLANNSLMAGVRMLQKSRPADAIPFFKKALAVDSSNVDAYNYLGNTYLSLKKNKEAIETYKKLVAMKPFDPDAKVSLANAYVQDKNYKDAEIQYKKAVSLTPASVLAHYSLGQTYLLQNKLKEAEAEFLKVNRLAPRDANGFYALGATYNKMGKFDAAITSLKKAISLKHQNFVLAETELGISYAGKGDDYLLEKQITRLKSMDSAAAKQLKDITFKPKILNVAYGPNNAFLTQLSAGTPLAMLTLLDPDKALEKPNTSKDFTIVFQFNTDMDPLSIQNNSNWNIRRAQGGTAGYYNHGVTLHPEKEAFVLPTPKTVSYNPLTQQATLTFTLKQNATADAVIDPSHIVFKFTGKDIKGHLIDQKADEFDGFAGKTF